MSICNVEYNRLLELTFSTKIEYSNPFAEIDVDCTFRSPSGREVTMPAFYDGGSVWRVRFTPKEIGDWKYKISTSPEDNNLCQQGTFTVEKAGEDRAFLRTCPGKYWGFEYENGKPCFLLGDTVYNLFAAAYCGMDVRSFLKRRKEQGFNIIRVRCMTGPFNHPRGEQDYNQDKNSSSYLTRSTWPWGGNPFKPRFDMFNLEYFHTVDEVFRMVDEFNMGLEVIMQMRGPDYPFNARNVFVAEWEEMWMRYLIARYDAFRSVYIWTLMNEYEYYPDGYHLSNNPLADRWAIRMARWIKEVAPHQHPVAVHAFTPGESSLPFAQRFKRDLRAVDVILFQHWGARDKKNAWLATGIDEGIKKSLNGWPGSAVLAEYGYERNPDLPLLWSNAQYLYDDHTRRGAWRGAFSGLGVMNGFQNSWGPYMILDEDQSGVHQLSLLKYFFTEVVPFHHLRPSPDLIKEKEYKPGHKPLCLSSKNKKQIVVYLPVGGEISLNIENISEYLTHWFDPRKGDLISAQPTSKDGYATFTKEGENKKGKPLDWVLFLETK